MLNITYITHQKKKTNIASIWLALFSSESVWHLN